MILVTGGAGFVGRHLLRALKTEREDVPLRVLDAQELPGNLAADVHLVRGLVHEPDDVAKSVADVDVVIHLAAKVEPDSRDFESMWRVNVEGTRILHSSAVAAGCARFLYVSSSGVYGQPRSAHPFTEDDEPRPVTPYQRTKLEAENVLRRSLVPTTSVNILRPAGLTKVLVGSRAPSL